MSMEVTARVSRDDGWWAVEIPINGMVRSRRPRTPLAAQRTRLKPLVSARVLSKCVRSAPFVKKA